MLNVNHKKELGIGWLLPDNTDLVSFTVLVDTVLHIMPLKKLRFVKNKMYTFIQQGRIQFVKMTFIMSQNIPISNKICSVELSISGSDEKNVSSVSSY